MNLKDAFPRPTGEETESALWAVAFRTTARPGPWSAWIWRTAAMVAGLMAAYATGFAVGRSRPLELQPLIVPTGHGEAPIVVRPPVLVAGPRS
jgi:hypothetical protein